VLSTGTWYRVEYKYEDDPGTVQVRLDGSEILSATADGANVQAIRLGLCSTSQVAGVACGGDFLTTGTLYFDDIALNDSTGGSQTAWPGAGSIVHMQPNAAGDNSGCGAGDYSSIDEITPDDGTSLCTLTTDGGGDIVDVNVESSSAAGIDSYDTVSLLQVGIRESAASAASEQWRTRVKSASGGTVSQGTATTHDDTTYLTNGDAIPRNYTLTSYTDPTTASAWTPTGTNSLDTMQIGATSVDGSPDIRLSTLWALIEYIDGVAPAVTERMRGRLRGGALKIQGGRMMIRSL
jgi:hypothetical protein